MTLCTRLQLFFSAYIYAGTHSVNTMVFTVGAVRAYLQRSREPSRATSGARAPGGCGLHSRAVGHCALRTWSRQYRLQACSTHPALAWLTQPPQRLSTGCPASSCPLPPPGLGRLIYPDRAGQDSSATCRARIAQARGPLRCGWLTTPATMRGPKSAGAPSTPSCYPAAAPCFH